MHPPFSLDPHRFNRFHKRIRHNIVIKCSQTFDMDSITPSLALLPRAPSDIS